MPQPRGSSDYVRQLKNRTIAASYVPRVGISLDSSTLTAARTGQRTQVVQPLHGHPYDVSGCCCAQNTNNINLIAGIPVSISRDGYNWMATVTWNDIGATYYSLLIEFEGSDTNPYTVEYDDQVTSVNVLFTDNPGMYAVQLTSHSPCGDVVTTATSIYD